MQINDRVCFPLRPQFACTISTYILLDRTHATFVLGCFVFSFQFDRVFLMDSDSFLLHDADSVFCNVPLLGDRLVASGRALAASRPRAPWRAFSYAAATEWKPPLMRVKARSLSLPCVVGVPMRESVAVEGLQWG